MFETLSPVVEDIRGILSFKVNSNPASKVPLTYHSEPTNEDPALFSVGGEENLLTDVAFYKPYYTALHVQLLR